MPHIQTVLGGAQGLYEGGQPTYADFSPTTESALQGFEGGSPAVSAAQNMLQGTLQGDYLTPDANPYLKSYYDAAAGDVTDSVNAEFTKAGRSMSPRHAEVLSRELGRLASNIYAPAYQQERGLQFGASAQAPTLGFANLDKQLSAGLARDTMAQREIDDPYNRINRYLSVIRGVPQGTESFGQQTTTSSPGALDWIGTVGGLLGTLGGGAGGIRGLFSNNNSGSVFGGSPS